MIDTGRTLTLAAKTLKEKGAKSVHALISHGLFLFLFILITYSLRSNEFT
jgi:phosphoribosylpyrophosphate synthetase